MKTWSKTLLLLLLPLCGMAQDSVLTISPAMFDKVRDATLLSSLDGWLFKQGSDTAWAKRDINTSGWEKLKPTELSAKYADKKGKVEGWFRVKIKPGNELDKQLGLSWISRAAADIYINGTLFSSFGNTGQNGKPFEESGILAHFWPLGVSLKSGADYTIAVHFVDYLSPFPPQGLRSQQTASNFMLRLSGPGTTAFLTALLRRSFIYHFTWASVCTVLSLLFWLLSMRNRSEKDLRLIAVCATLFALVTYVLARQDISDTPFMEYMVNEMALGLLIELIFIIIPLTLANIFKRAVSRKFKVLLIVIFLYSVVNILLAPVWNILWATANLFLIIVSIYYIASSWKKLHGAQWCIVAGLLSSVLFGAAMLVSVAMNRLNPVNEFIFYFTTGFVLSLPLSMLGYVAMRFSEIIKEVQQNAAQVVQLSEEKKQEALNRQTILEAEVNRQTAEIRNTLDNLKSTQTQLIQSEKMASLGELTAGIAHEIQNPLNFVNNFSEVSVELLEELKAENGKPKAERDEKLETELIDGLIENQEKIHHHGKRADSIVKGMLEHSRASTGQKEPTDINKLADEYLRLAYHGLRAKDKSFNAELITHLDENLPKVNVVAQDIGRVLLNLFNNAFYAVKEKAKIAGPDYKPTVQVTTFTPPLGGWGVLVKDNGNGIPDAIKDKIMQPFFTTKPTGEGTGLGLSLSYDIVVKGHGGNIDVKSIEGEGSEFIIQLPLNNS